MTPVAHWSDELTQAAGEVIGTPAFMSPEQARGEAHGVGPASDVYSLGATLYMLLTGRAPFDGSELEETLRSVIAGSFTRPRELSRAIPPALEAVCLKAMARPPQDRYGSPRELADDIEHWLADEPVSAAREPIVARLARWGRRHRTRVVAGSIALVLITIVSVVAAIRINGERLRADGERIEANRQRIEADRQRIEADSERNEADRQRIEANRRNARLAFDRGFALTRDHEHGEGMLWFARALEHAPADDAALRRVILTNLDAARHYLLHRRTAFAFNTALGRIAFSPDGKRLVSTNDRGSARLWNVESGAMLSEQKLRSGVVVAVRVSDDGTVLVALDASRSVSVQRLPTDAAAPSEPAVAMLHDQTIACAAFSPDGNVLATGSRTNGPSKTRLWRVSDGERLGVLDHPTSVLQIVFRPESREVATVAGDGRVRFWELTDGPPSHEVQAPVREVTVESRRVRTIAFTPDGKRMLAGDFTGTISDWDIETGRRLPDSAHQSGQVTAIAVASDGKTVDAAWDTGMARVWNLASRAAFCEMLRLDRYAGRLTIRPGTRQLLIATDPQTAVLWEVPDPARLAPVLSQRQVSSIAFSPDGEKAITGSRNWTARLRDTATGTMTGRVMPHQEGVLQVAFRPDGAVVLTASADGTARLWNARDGRARGQVMDHRAATGDRVQVGAAVFSPDPGDPFVVTGDGNGVIRTWNGDTGEPVRVFEKIKDGTGAVGSLCFSPSGDRVVAGFGLGDVGVWDAQSGKLLWTVRHGNRVRAVAMSPLDGQLVMSASNNETARFWNAADGRPVGEPLRHRGQVFVAKFSPDGKLAVTGGFDATVRLWEVPSGRPVGEPMRHDGVVATAAFSGDGTRLLTGGSRDRTARLWDVATCLPLSPPLEHDEDVFSVAIHPAGHVAFTGRFWRLPSPLTDDPALIDLWVKLATQRAFTSGDNVEWLARDELASLSAEFHARTGKSWSEWAD